MGYEAVRTAVKMRSLCNHWSTAIPEITRLACSKTTALYENEGQSIGSPDVTCQLLITVQINSAQNGPDARHKPAASQNHHYDDVLACSKLHLCMQQPSATFQQDICKMNEHYSHALYSMISGQASSYCHAYAVKLGQLPVTL